MTHFVCGVVIPKEEKENYESYLDSVLEPYSEYHEVDAHITITKEDVLNEYKRSKSQKDLREWAEDYYGEEMDEEGNMLSNYNEDSFFDWYNIGGRWDGEFTGEKGNNLMKVSELIEKFKRRRRELNYGLVSTLKKIETGKDDTFNKYLLWCLVTDEVYNWWDLSWFGTSTNSKEKKEWEEDYLSILESHREDYICFVDCHI